MTGQDVNDLLYVLSDPDRVTWPLPMRLEAINAGVRDIANAKPKAMTVSLLLDITPGTTRQAVPADVVALLDLTANMGATASRRAGTSRLSRPIGWPRACRAGAGDKGTAIKHLVIDDRDPARSTCGPPSRRARGRPRAWRRSTRCPSRRSRTPCRSMQLPQRAE
jgi:hypothetical protein